MDNRTLRPRKARPRSARPYDRQNQSIFGKVCSKVKGLLNPSWLLNVSNWISNSEEQQPGGSSDDVEETVREDNDVMCQSSSHGSKRLRLRFDDTVPSIQSSGTQTWPEQPTQNLYETVSHVQSSTTQSSLLDNKETMAVLNGDDHSENSEGSASTSGCSSLVSSHKESNRLIESPFVNLLDLKSSRKRKLPPSKSGINDLDGSRSLWSSNFSPKFQRRLPTISHTNQPSFNLSTFVGPSKMNETEEKKVSSPFYEGRTTFGGASASRRMPPSVALYQTNRNERNKIRVREQNSEDSSEGMSSTARRILLTLEQMSTPVADAQKIPNSDKSPIDLSLYLTPPKSRRNSQFTPCISKGPPIANINTIAKLATLKNYGASRLRSSLLSPSPSTSKSEKKSDLQPKPYVFSNPVEPELLKNSNILSKENIPVPPPNDSKIEKKFDVPPKPFVFSSPIEHELPNNSLPKENIPLSTFDSKTEKKSDLPPKPFVFSSPIEHELPSNNNNIPKEITPSPVSTSASTSISSPLTWKCSSCLVQNTSTRNSCVACEMPKVSKETSSGLKFNITSGNISVSSTGFSFGAPTSSSVFTFGTSKAETQNVTPSKSLSFTSGSKTSTWECDACWIRNPEADSKCKDCKAARPQMESEPVKISSTGFSFGAPTSSPVFSFGTSKAESENVTPSKPLTFSSEVNSTISSPHSTWECTSCWVRNPMKEKKCMACETLHPSADLTPGFTFKFEKPVTTLSNSWSATPGPTVTTLSTTSGFKFGSGPENPQVSPVSTSQSTTNPVVTSSDSVEHETSKAEAQTTTATNFSFGSGLISSNKPAFQLTQPETVTFKFGNPTSENVASTVTTPSSFSFSKKETSNQIPASGPQNSVSSNNFVFGLKSDTSNQIPSTVSQPAGLADVPSSNITLGGKNENINTSQNTVTSTFGSSSTTASICGNNSVQPSSGVEQPLNGGLFKFGVATSGTFPFGATTKTISVSSATVANSPPLSTWECSSCLVRNSDSNTSCVACEAPRVPKETASTIASKGSEETKGTPAVSTSASVSSTGFNFGNLTSTSAVFSFGTSQSQSQTVKSTKPFSFGLGSNVSTWECKSCSIRNPETESKCKSCAAACPPKESLNSKNVNNTLPNSFSTWECSSCLVRNPMKENKCMACEALHPNANTSSGFTFKGFEKPQTSLSVTSSTSQTTTSALSVGLTATASPGGFVFGNKTEAQNTTTTPFVFGSGHEKPHTTSSVTSTTSQSATSGLNVGVSAPVSSEGFTFGTPKTEAQKTVPVPFSFGSGFEKLQTTASTTSQSTTSGPSIGSTVSVSSGGFGFGTSKSEAQNTAAPPFPFGSGATTTSNTSAFSAFQPTQAANPTFQFKFGSQPSGSTAPTIGTSSTFSFAKSKNSNQLQSSTSQNPVSVFGSTSTNFVFGSKSDTSNQIPNTVSQPSGLAFGSPANFTFSGKNENASAASQNPTATFGSSAMQSVFGSTPVQSFSSADKPVTGGFSFGVAAPSVFQFGAPSNNAEKKRTATASGFSFGTPAAPETNNSFSSGFNMNTPPSFNFGATSTPAGPFQFAASSAPTSAPAQNVHRKYRKAVRRVARKD